MLKMRSGKLVLGCLLSCLLLGSAPAKAETTPDTIGPAKVKLAGNLGTLDLPKGYEFWDQAKAREIMSKGGGNSDDVIGLLGPTDSDKFHIALEYEASGYVEDKDADKIDAKAILESYQEHTEENNEYRKEHNIPALHVTGWEQEPRYDSKHHVVTWSLQGTEEGVGPLVNYNTRVLTRKGVLSANLMCGNEDLPAARPKAQDLVTKISFNQGERYEDYQAGTDKISSGGLVALIAGGALLAKKTGVIAFLYVMFKPMLLFIKALGAKAVALVVAAFAGLKNVLTGKRNSTKEG
jgi:uncharacterized membrane-anchored protein